MKANTPDGDHPGCYRLYQSQPASSDSDFLGRVSRMGDNIRKSLSSTKKSDPTARMTQKDTQKTLQVKQKV